METAALLGGAYVALATSLSLYVLTRRREPSITLAWILGFFLFPYIGALLYMFFGYRRYRRKYKAKPHPAALATDKKITTKNLHAPLALQSEVEHLSFLAERLTGFPPVPGNEAEYFLDPGTALQAVFRAIDQATDHVHLSYYIVSHDAAGEELLKHLSAAVKRNVHCRLLLDSVGSIHLRRKYVARLQDAGVRVAFFSPLKRFKRLWHLHLRNHRKIAVIDGKMGFIGSQNIVENYTSVPAAQRAWMEIVLSVEGPGVLQLQAVFAEDWRYATAEALDPGIYFPPTKAAGKLPMQTVPTGPDLPEQTLHLIFLSLINAAQKSVTVITPYLVPTNPVALALEGAARRGVRVSIVVPRRPDNIIALFAGHSWYPALLESGVNLYEHPSSLHAKAILIDEHIALIGSANIDARSFQLNFEAGMIAYGPEPVIALQKSADAAIRAAQPVRLADLKRNNVFHLLVEGLARLLSPLL